MQRRAFLALASAFGAWAATPRRLRALGPKSAFRFAQLQLGDGWDPRPNALRRLAWELEKRTSIEVALEPVATSLASPTLHETPFMVLAGDRGFDLPPTAELEALRRYLTFGGFLLIDSAEGVPGGAFDASVRHLLEQVFPRPTPGLAVVPPDHVALKSFYLLDRPVGRVASSPTLEGLTRDGRLIVAYCQNDLGGAWSRDNLGNFEFPCEPGGERQRELSFRLGVNLVMYALCLDYKTDQVHVPFIMRRRRWKPDDGANVPGRGSSSP